MTNKLIVVAGPAHSGKYPLAKKLLAETPNSAMVHRDTLRGSLISVKDEAHITHIMSAIANELLHRKYTPIICAWNLEKFDSHLWTKLSRFHNVELVWYDTRHPDVQAMIPPMEVKPLSEMSYAEMQKIYPRE